MYFSYSLCHCSLVTFASLVTNVDLHRNCCFLPQIHCLMCICIIDKHDYHTPGKKWLNFRQGINSAEYAIFWRKNVVPL